MKFLAKNNVFYLRFLKNAKTNGLPGQFCKLFLVI